MEDRKPQTTLKIKYRECGELMKGSPVVGDPLGYREGFCLECGALTVTNRTVRVEVPTSPQLQGQVDLTSYHWIVVNSSAGKDSQAMLGAVVREARSQGVDLGRVVVVHADLGRVEWEGTKELARAQAQRYGLRFEVVHRDQDLLDQIVERGMFPDSQNRYCTSDQKTAQVHKLFTRLARETGGKGVRILSCLGIRAQESPARAKKNPFETEKKPSNKTKTVHRWLLIFHWTVEDVWNEIRTGETSDLAHHAYASGMTRLSCCFCVFASKGDLAISARENRNVLAEYARAENLIGHTFTSSTSIQELARDHGMEWTEPTIQERRDWNAMIEAKMVAAKDPKRRAALETMLAAGRERLAAHEDRF